MFRYLKWEAEVDDTVTKLLIRCVRGK